MEVEKIQTQGCMLPKIGNNGGGDDLSKKIGQKCEQVEQYPDDDEDRKVKILGGNGSGSEIGGVSRLSMWPASRIVRVSRASGGKDRHSKVLTSHGLRDRRIRLSVTTAIQFYDLQDRLKVDQPSKAVEWLLKAASKSIDELPSINISFPHTHKELSNEKKLSSGDLNPNFEQQQQHVSLSKSACSSNSETSKGSGLCVLRSENRVKARERARERMAEKEKEKESETTLVAVLPNRPNVNRISLSSFTELLTGGINNVSNTNNTSPSGSAQQFQKTRHWSSTPMDYFSTGILSPSTSRHHHLSGFSAQMGNTQQQSMTISPFNHQSEMQHLSFVPEQNDYNCNFTISSSRHAGLNRGTLQSNSHPSLSPHLQRLSPTVDASSLPFYASPNAAAMDNHRQFPDDLDGGLQLCYGDGGSDQKGKRTS